MKTALYFLLFTASAAGTAFLRAGKRGLISALVLCAICGMIGWGAKRHLDRDFIDFKKKFGRK